MKTRSFRVLFTVILSIVVLAALQCSRRSPTSPQGEKSIQGNGLVRLEIQMSKPLAQVIDRVVVIAQNPSKGTVRGNLYIEGARATGSLQVPAGYEWTITAEAYIGETKCYSGKSQPVYVSAEEEIQVTVSVNRLDSDGDGFYNDEDLFPYGDAKIQVVLKRFTVFSNDGAWDTESEIYFLIKVDEFDFRAEPSGDHWWKCGVGNYIRPNWSREVDAADNSRYHEINIQMWDDDDTAGDDLYDLDGSDETKGLTLKYDLKTGAWTGDDTDGVADGREDNIYGEVNGDGYLEYEIKTVLE